jgi:hypothetical protein
MINKSFQLIRTNPALTTNVKLVVDSNYRLYLESFDTNTQLSDQKYKHHRINSDTLYEREIVKFYDGLSNQLAFDVKYDSDNTSVFKTYDKQFDDMYWAGAKYVDDNWYEEDGEYFAPLYIRKGDIPEGFIILRVDEATPYEETDNEFSLAKLTKDNFNSQIVDKWKCVSFYDMRYQSKLGNFLSNNFIENTRFPSRAFELNFRKYEFSKWYGIDYIAGAYVNKSKFLQNTLFYEQPHFRLEKEILDVYKSENIIFPNILNLKFLFKDIPATPNSIRNYSLNRYYGFYADKLEFVTNLTSYLTSEIRPNLTLRNNIFIENDVESIESPFVEGFDPTKTYWLNIGEDFYEVVKIMENNKYVYKIISDIDFSGVTLTNFNDRSCIINYIEGYNYRCRTINNPSGYTNFVSGFTSNFKIDTYFKNNQTIEITVNSGETLNQLVNLQTYTVSSGVINEYNVVDNGYWGGFPRHWHPQIEWHSVHTYTVGSTYQYNTSNTHTFVYNCTLQYIGDIEIPMYGDLYLILIDNQYHILKYRDGNYYVQSDYAINSFPSVLEYWKGGKYSKYYVSKPVYKYKEKPLMYPVYRVKFSDVKDFDFDRVNTHFSDFEYEKDTYHVTPEHKLYAVDYPKSTAFNKVFMMHPRGVDGQYQIMNVSSEYVADDELYEISFNDLTSIWRKNQSVVKWGFVGSNAQCDYPYKLNNSLDIGDVYNRTCDIKNSMPISTAKNLDYFYRIGNLYTTETYEDIFSDGNGLYHVLPENGYYAYDPQIDAWVAVFPDGNVYVDVQRQNPPLPSYTPFDQPDSVYSRTGNVISTTPLRYLNQSTNIDVDFMEDYSKKFNLDLYLNSNVDYFEYFFKNKAYYTIDDINYVKPTVKYAVFQNGDSYSPSTTIFKGLNINILPINNITRERATGKILNYITDNNKNFNDYKFSIILNDVYEYYDGNVYSGITENGLTENNIIDKKTNGIHVFLNERFKNVLIIINIKIEMQSKFLTLNNVDRFGENYGLYTGKRLDGGSFITPLDSDVLSPNHTFIKESYNPALISAANFIDAFDDMNSISEFDSGITFYYLNSAGQFGSTGPINIYSTNSMINIPGWNQLYPPFILTINDPELLATKKISYSKDSIKGPTTNIYDKYKTFYDSDSKQKSNIVEPLARKMELNVIQDNLGDSQIYRYNGVYEPIFKDVPLFNNIFLYKSGNTAAYIPSNSKFDTSFKNFGSIEELIFSKVNPIESPLKLKDTDKDISIYPMVDEYGYQYLNRFIFNSNWDKDFYIMTNKDNDTLVPQVTPPAPIPIDTEPPSTPCAAINLFGGNNISLIWAPSTDNVEVAYYLVFRSVGDSNPNSPNFSTPYATVSTSSILVGTTNLYWSETINLTLAYYYYVVAVDTSGNISGHCGIVSVIPTPVQTICPTWPATPTIQLTLTPIIASPPPPTLEYSVVKNCGSSCLKTHGSISVNGVSQYSWGIFTVLPNAGTLISNIGDTIFITGTAYSSGSGCLGVVGEIRILINNIQVAFAQDDTATWSFVYNGTTTIDIVSSCPIPY